VRKVTYSMGMSLDGFIEGPDGDFQWTEPEPALFQMSIDEVKDVGVHLLGRRLYETMLYWEEIKDDLALGAQDREWTDLWNALPKVVFSRTLTDVVPSARLATGTLAEEIARLRAEPGEGDIAIGGADLAAQAADLDLVDEYLVRVFPVLVGGGKPIFALHERRVDLELLASRTFESGVVSLHYRVRRDADRETA
jgi:dihydrofolate reductase